MKQTLGNDGDSLVCAAVFLDVLYTGGITISRRRWGALGKN